MMGLKPNQLKMKNTKGPNERLDYVNLLMTKPPSKSQLPSLSARDRDLKTLLDEPVTAKRATIFMAKTGLLGQLGKAYLVDVDARGASA